MPAALPTTRDNAAEGARVILLVADPARWKGPSRSRFAPIKPDGAFAIGPVRPGDYLIAAIEADDAPMMMGPEPEYLERIARVAQRITLLEDDRQTIDLRVTRLR